MNTTPKIVVIDDDPAMVTLVTRILRMNNHEALIAKDGKEGWELCLREKPDIVITDVMMPNIDGYELCKRIKNTEETKDAYVILLTAKTQKDDIIFGLNIGADDYMVKPFNKEELQARIDAAIRNQEIRRELIVLEKSNSLKTLVGGMSHLFNNLLGGIRGHLEMAQLRNDPRFTMSAMETAIYNIDACALIIKNLSYYSEKEFMRRLQKVQLDEILRNFIATHHDAIEKKGIVLIEDIQKIPPVNIDPAAIEDVIANLLANAVQACEKTNSTICISLQQNDNALTLTIKDDGPGMAEKELACIFDPFFSTKSCRPVVANSGRGLNGRDIPGHGLGLPVAQGIIQAHGGKLNIQSASGKGCSATITLFYETP